MTGKRKAVRPVAEVISSAGCHNHLSKFSSSKEDLEAIRMKREREEADRVKLDEGERAFTARCFRRLARIEKWAESRSREELVEDLALAVLLLIEKNKSARHAAEIRRHMDVAVDASTLNTQVHKRVALNLLKMIVEMKEKRRISGNTTAEISPKTKAMDAIEAEFVRWQDGKVKYKNSSKFAQDMMLIHGAVLDNERSIENNCIKWRKKRKNHPAS